MKPDENHDSAIEGAGRGISEEKAGGCSVSTESLSSAVSVDSVSFEGCALVLLGGAALSAHSCSLLSLILRT